MKNDVEKVFNKFQMALIGNATEPYSDRVVELVYEPLNVAEMDDPDGIGFAKGSCGDSMQVFLRLTKGCISEATFLSVGCSVTLACGSAVTDLVIGKTPYEAGKIYPQTVVNYLHGLPASHMHCAVLAVQSLRKALDSMKSS